jgi:hypothetical protein
MTVRMLLVKGLGRVKKAGSWLSARLLSNDLSWSVRLWLATCGRSDVSEGAS